MSNPITVMQAAAFKEPYLELVPHFEHSTGRRVETLWVPTVDIVRRISAGEVVDMIIMASQAIDELMVVGRLPPGSRVDIARSGIGVAVRAGAPRPDISSWETLKHALLAAEGVAYSVGPSGVYMADLFERAGIADAIKPKVKVVKGAPAGELAVRGEVDIVFQQVCELLPIAGIDFVGPLPQDIQKITVFSAAVHPDAKESSGARALVEFLAGPAAAPIIRAKGLEPIDS